MKNLFKNPFKNDLELQRYPFHPRDLLQAWDSADELILQHLSGMALKSKRILIMNDGFGALSCTLDEFEITTYTDSFVSARAIELNSGGKLTALHDLGELSGIYDLVLIKLPKNTSFFEDQLCHLSHHLGASSKVICGYMIKHQSKTSFDLLNRYIGETSTSLAQKKARLIFTDFQKGPAKSPYPLMVSIEGFEKCFVQHSNLFSREKLDIGTRFLLENLPEGDYRTILDLGCANGIVGIAAKKLNPSAQIIFSDESWMAIQSARANYETYFPEPATYVWTNCYENRKAASLDLVICNPPFHHGTTLGDHIARQMFKDARHALAPGGQLRVIGNSHLQYNDALRGLFGNARNVAQNRKFMIVDAVK